MLIKINHSKNTSQKPKKKPMETNHQRKRTSTKIKELKIKNSVKKKLTDMVSFFYLVYIRNFICHPTLVCKTKEIKPFCIIADNHSNFYQFTEILVNQMNFWPAALAWSVASLIGPNCCTFSQVVGRPSGPFPLRNTHSKIILFSSKYKS